MNPPISPRTSCYSEFPVEKTLLCTHKDLTFSLLTKDTTGISWTAQEASDAHLSAIFKTTELSTIKLNIQPPKLGYSDLIEHTYKSLTYFEFNSNLLPYLTGLHHLVNLKKLIIGSKNTKLLEKESQELKKIQWDKLQSLAVVEIYSGRITESVTSMTAGLKSLKEFSCSLLSEKEPLRAVQQISQNIVHVDLVCTTLFSECLFPTTLHISKELDFFQIPGNKVVEVIFKNPFEIKLIDNQFPDCKRLTIYHQQLNHETLYSFPCLEHLTVLNLGENIEFNSSDLGICKHLKSLELDHSNLSHELVQAAERINRREAITPPPSPKNDKNPKARIKRLTRSFSHLKKN